MLVCAAGSTLMSAVVQFSFTKNSEDEEQVMQWIDNLLHAHGSLSLAMMKAAGVKMEDMQKMMMRGGGRGVMAAIGKSDEDDRDRSKHGGYL